MGGAGRPAGAPPRFPQAAAPPRHPRWPAAIRPDLLESGCSGGCPGDHLSTQLRPVRCLQVRSGRRAAPCRRGRTRRRAAAPRAAGRGSAPAATAGAADPAAARRPRPRTTAPARRRQRTEVPFSGALGRGRCRRPRGPAPPAYHASSASAADAIRSHTASGSSGTSSGSMPRCSATSSRRSPRAKESRGAGVSRSVTRTSCTAQAISESLDQERRLKLSDPTLAHTSSMTQTLACT